MDIELVLEKKNRLEFQVKKGSVPFMNMVRRCGIGQVPVFAIDTITVYENSSSMFDEYIAHRLGQVPLVSDTGKAKEEISFTLDASGPGMVYSKELKSADSKVKSSFANIPLLRLLEGQNLRLEAKARRGIGRNHSKFQAGVISYEVLSDGELKLMSESFMQYEPREFLMKAADTIIEKCDDFEKNLLEIKG